MKYNWAAVSTELRKIVLENVRLVGRNEFDTKDWMFDLKFRLDQTDEFHPWDSDTVLSNALRDFPEGRCNYRNCESYWAHKYGKGDVLDGVYGCLIEMGEAIEEYYGERYNFPPRSGLPTQINMPSEWAWDKIAGKCWTRIQRAAKQKKA